MKKLLAMIIAGVMLAGCGKSDDDSQTSETTPAPPEVTSPDTIEIEFNLDLIGAIGLKYEEITERYGRPIMAYDDEGGPILAGVDGGFYTFQDGYGIYSVSDELVCYGIGGFSLEKLFVGLTYPTSLYELRQIPEIEFFFENAHGVSFLYEGGGFPIGINIATPNTDSINSGEYTVTLLAPDLR
jgi:hypothetical protein